MADPHVPVPYGWITAIGVATSAAGAAIWRYVTAQFRRAQESQDARLATAETKLESCEERHAETQQTVIDLSSRVGRLEGRIEGRAEGVALLVKEVVEAVRDSGGSD